jgi:hypothetical protein
MKSLSAVSDISTKSLGGVREEGTGKKRGSPDKRKTKTDVDIREK